LFIVHQKEPDSVRARESFVCQQNCTALASGLRPELDRGSRAQRLRLIRERTAVQQIVSTQRAKRDLGRAPVDSISRDRDCLARRPRVSQTVRQEFDSPRWLRKTRDEVDTMPLANSWRCKRR